MGLLWRLEMIVKLGWGSGEKRAGQHSQSWPGHGLLSTRGYLKASRSTATKVWRWKYKTEDQGKAAHQPSFKAWMRFISSRQQADGTCFVA